jgi:hypothetical protein
VRTGERGVSRETGRETGGRERGGERGEREERDAFEMPAEDWVPGIDESHKDTTPGATLRYYYLSLFLF